MRRQLLTLALGAVLAGGAFACSGGVDTKPPAGDDDVADDDDGTTVTPTPSPTATTTPTPGLVGDPWTTTATPSEDSCAVGSILVPYGNAGVKTIGITQTNGTVVFDVGMHLDPNVAIGTEPSGTLTGTAFTQTFSYCTYNGLSTYKYSFNWTGDFDAGFTTFSSTLGLSLRIENGNFMTTCSTHSFPAFGDCTSGALSYSVAGVKQ